MEVDQSAEGTPQVSEGNGQEQELEQDKFNGKPVAFKTYDKVISTLKTKEAKLQELQEKANLYEQREKEREEKALAEQGEYKKLLEVRDSELNELRAKEEVRQKETLMQLKASAFLDKLPGQLDKSEYLAFANLDNIAFNPDTNAVDEMSLEPVVNEFVKNHSKLFTVKGGPRLPVGAPQANTPLSFKDELKKCQSQKEIDALLAKHKLGTR